MQIHDFAHKLRAVQFLFFQLDSIQMKEGNV